MVISPVHLVFFDRSYPWDIAGQPPNWQETGFFQKTCKIMEMMSIVGPMEHPKMPLLSSAAHDFARATCGSDRARTTTFLNVNLQDLGAREWMEAYSINGADWILKRMVFQQGESGGAIHQHTQRQNATMNFISALNALAEYEEAQIALGYLNDADDMGQVTGVPLFRDVAKAEGIPHDLNGRLVVPQNGHIVSDGVYPVDAFAIAATGYVKKTEVAVVQNNPSRIFLNNASGSYIMMPEMANLLQRYTGDIVLGLDHVRKADRATLLNNCSYIPFRYRAKYHDVMSNALVMYRGGVPAENLRGTDDTSRHIPRKLLSYLRYNFVSADVMLRGVLLSSMLKQEQEMIAANKTVSASVQRVINRAIMGWRRSGREFSSLLTKAEVNDMQQLRDINVDDVFQSVENTITQLQRAVKSTSVDLDAIPDFEDKMNDPWESDGSAYQRSLPLNTGPR